MTNGDYIRNMDDDRLAAFLFIWGINTLGSFMAAGGTKVMNAQELREWMQKEEFECVQTHVGEELTINKDFTRKEQNERLSAE